MTQERIAAVLIIGYAAAVVIAFGPASVEEDRVAKQDAAECAEVFAGSAVDKRRCEMFAYNEFRPAMKAVLWPFWLSYVAARKVAE